MIEELLPVVNVLGRLLCFFSFTYAIPVVGSLVMGDGLERVYGGATFVTLAAGLILYSSTRRHYRELRSRGGFILVVAAWAMMAGIATLPFLTVYPHMSFTDAYFETMSGLTTTGATVMTGLDGAPPSINLWRHELNWLGGMGIIVLAVAVLPLLGVGGMQLYKAEVPGPIKDTKLTARISDTAKALWRDAEARAVVSVLVVSTFGVAGYLWETGTYPSFPTALRHTAFNLVSMATDCGYASQDFGHWPIFASLWMFFLSCVTVSSGSTGGGIKMIRTLSLAKQARRELTRLVHPAMVDPVKIGGASLPGKIIIGVLGFIFLYFMSIVGMSFLLMLSGLDFLSAFTAIIACINNAGPGLNQVGPATNYAGLSNFQIWVCVFTMLLGRLEVLSLLVLFTPDFWRR